MNTQITKDASQSDEIDLVDLIKTLWDKKWWIVLSTFVCTALAGIYAFTAKEQWTSNAIVSPPRGADISNLLNIYSKYYRIIEDDKFNDTTLSNSLYEKFKYFLISDDIKRTYLEQTRWYQENSKDLDDSSKNILLHELVDNLEIIEIDAKKRDVNTLDRIGQKIKFSINDPKVSQHILNMYINYVNNYTLYNFNTEFKINLIQTLESLKFKKNNIESKLKEEKIVKIENLEKALDISKKAGVKDFIKDDEKHQNIPEYLLGNAKINLSESKLADDIYLFMLGEKYLQAQLDTNRANEVTYPTEYYLIARKIHELELLKHELENIIHSNNSKVFYYLSAPNFPINLEHPKRALIILLGCLIGLLLSSSALVLKFLLTSKREN